MCPISSSMLFKGPSTEERKELDMKIGILQHDYVVGDCVGNGRKIIEGYERLRGRGADLVVGTELAILGYPPRDLLNHRAKLREQGRVLFEEIAPRVGDVPLVLGFVDNNPSSGKSLLNKAVFIRNKHIREEKIKELLPEYDVFDERRYFEPGPHKPCIVPYMGKRIALLICEDIWGGTTASGHDLYETNPVENIVGENPDVLVIINASPYQWGKGDMRIKLVREVAKKVLCPVVYVNPVGGNDELIFDGRSFGVKADGTCFGAARSFVEEELLFDTESEVPAEYPFDDNDLGELYNALVLGVRDYCAKTGYEKAVIAESGGIDSALVTCIARDALGAENVIAIGMPSDFSSAGSVDHARALCQNLDIEFRVVPIKNLYREFGNAVSNLMGWESNGYAFGKDVTEENVQARLRGAIIMAYSNRYNAMVLSTGNKSELAVGYCTLYGDMVGGLAVIGDILKTFVYGLARHINASRGEVIPWEIINKAPSAELRPGQKDQDSLPPYDVLDAILLSYVDKESDPMDMVTLRIDPAIVKRVIAMVDNAEYKRRQAAPCLRVTGKAFGPGRRLPIAIKPRE